MPTPSLIATLESVNAHAKQEAEKKGKKFFPLDDEQKANAGIMYDVATKAGLDPSMAIGQMYLETKLRPYSGTNEAGARGASQFLKGTAEQYGIDWNKLGSSVQYDYGAYVNMMQKEIAAGKIKTPYDAGVFYHAGPGGLATGKGVGPKTIGYATAVDAIVSAANGNKTFAIDPRMKAENGPRAEASIPFQNNPVIVYESAKQAFARDAVAAYKPIDEQSFGGGAPAQLLQLAETDPALDKMATRLGDMWDATPFYKGEKRLSEIE